MFLLTSFNKSQAGISIANAILQSSSTVNFVVPLFDNCVIRDLLISVRLDISALLTDLFVKNNPNSVINLEILHTYIELMYVCLNKWNNFLKFG
jgi:hypothetical protein